MKAILGLEARQSRCVSAQSHHSIILNRHSAPLIGLTAIRRASSPVKQLRCRAGVPASAIFVGVCLAGSDARDLGQWKSNDPRLSQWFRGLMQPDTIPPVSCCGEADAYWADQVRVGPNGEIIAAITDDREDGPLRRMHEDIGNKYIVPPNKIIKKDVNPTGHAIIFLGTSSIFGLRSEPRPVLCYVMNGEV